jgi:hypothetical protein
MPESLWRSSDPQRFFLIPDEFTPPVGDFVIRSLTGERRLVNAASLAEYERTKEQATEWLQGKMGQAVEGVRGWAHNLADRLTGVGSDPLGALREAVARTQHLASGIASDPSRFQEPADMRTIACLVASLREIADRLGSAVIKAAPPI